MTIDKYEKGDTFYLLLRPIDAMGVLEDWLIGGYPDTDFLCHQSKKNKGKVVLETKDVMFANRVLSWHPNCQVSIKKATGQATVAQPIQQELWNKN